MIKDKSQEGVAGSKESRKEEGSPEVTKGREKEVGKSGLMAICKGGEGEGRRIAKKGDLGHFIRVAPIAATPRKC